MKRLKGVYGFASLCVGVGAGCALMLFNVSASTEVVDRAIIGVPASCTMSGSGMDTHNAEILNGTVNSSIGETNINAFCNDGEGFAIYAIGYTDDEDGKTVLASSTLGSSFDIITGTATGPVSGGDVSNWAMKLSTATNPAPTYPITIQNSFDSFHLVPSEHTLVAKRTEGTDAGATATGANFKTTYQVYISSEQPASTYTGQVKYTLVHPVFHPIPNETMLDIGKVVNTKMKTLAAGTDTAYNTKTSDIKAIRMADELPAGFVPSEANTVSTSTSRHPIYIFFDNTDDAGIMYFYSGGYQVVMNPDSSRMFGWNLALSDISGLEYWNSSQVTTLYALLLDSVIELTNVDSLHLWDTSKVQDLAAAFAINGSTSNEGYLSKLTDISGLMYWNTSNVTNVYMIFQNDTILTDLSPLANWDVSNVENMLLMLAGGNSLSHAMTYSDISPLANWNVSNVTNMSSMFQNASSLTDLFPLANWDVSNVENMRLMFAGTREVRMTYSDISPLTDWKVSSVTNMQAMFQNAVNITDLSPLAKWDVSNVEHMNYMFSSGSSTPMTYSDLSPLANWDVSNVTGMSGMFENAVLLTDLSPLANWNVSSVTEMKTMFQNTKALTDISPIIDWDVSGVTAATGSASSSANNFYRMFYNSSANLEPFTKRAGSWDSAGTYIPSS